MKLHLVSATKFFLISLAMMALTVVAGLNDATAQEGKNLYLTKGCSGCHGKDGKGVANIKNTPFPKLAGQNPTYVINQLEALKSGARKGASSALMRPFAMTLSTEQIKKIADYLANVK